MLVPLISALLIASFGFFNLLGIRPDLISNQILFLILAAAVFVITQRLGMHFFKHNAKALYWFFIFLLLITYVIGFEARGSKRWIDLYFFNFQPSEFLKIFFISFFAMYFSEQKKYLENAVVFLKSLVYFLVPTIIIFLQPDLGNAIVFVVIYCAILLFSAVPKRFILYLVISIVILLPLGFSLLQDYQKARLTSFIDASEDQHGASYNMAQAVITTGSGKLLGRGLGYGTQSKLLYLPENHTDFAFSSLVEQFGFIGGLVVIFLFMTLIFTLLRRALPSGSSSDEDQEYRYLYTIGFSTYLVFQTFVNIAMNMGLMPIVGIVLPLISYGGSSLLTIALGLALAL